MPARAVPHLDHPFWVYHYKPFLAERAKHLAEQTEVSPERRPADAPVAGPPRPGPAGTSAHLRLGAVSVLRGLRARLVGRLPYVGPLHPYYNALKPTYALLERRLPPRAGRILVVSDHDGPLTLFTRGLSRRGHTVYEAPALLQADTPAHGLIVEEVLRQVPFDLLVSEVTFAGLLKFAAFVRSVQTELARPG